MSEKIPQSLAIFESGEPKSPIDFQPFSNEDSTVEGKGEGRFYAYTLKPSDIPCNGTILVKDKNTGKIIKAIPANQYFLISRECKIHEFTKLEATDTFALVDQFGTRQAQRIYNMRQGASKT